VSPCCILVEADGDKPSRHFRLAICSQRSARCALFQINSRSRRTFCVPSRKNAASEQPYAKTIDSTVATTSPTNTKAHLRASSNLGWSSVLFVTSLTKQALDILVPAASYCVIAQIAKSNRTTISAAAKVMPSLRSMRDARLSVT